MIIKSGITVVTVVIKPLEKVFTHRINDLELKVVAPSYINLSMPYDKKPARLDIYLKTNKALSGLFSVDLEAGIKVRLPAPSLYLFVDIDVTLLELFWPDVFRLEWPISGIPPQAISLERGDVGVYALVVPVKEAVVELENLTVGEWYHIGSYNLYVVEEEELMALGVPTRDVIIGEVTSLELPQKSGWITVSVDNPYGASWRIYWSGGASGSRTGVSSDSWRIWATSKVDFRAEVLSNPSGYACSIYPSSITVQLGEHASFRVDCNPVPEKTITYTMTSTIEKTVTETQMREYTEIVTYTYTKPTVETVTTIVEKTVAAIIMAQPFEITMSMILSIVAIFIAVIVLVISLTALRKKRTS
jgi:hypothetical protein